MLNVTFDSLVFPPGRIKLNGELIYVAAKIKDIHDGYKGICDEITVYKLRQSGNDLFLDLNSSNEVRIPFAEWNGVFVRV